MIQAAWRRLGLPPRADRSPVDLLSVFVGGKRLRRLIDDQQLRRRAGGGIRRRERAVIELDAPRCRHDQLIQALQMLAIGAIQFFQQRDLWPAESRRQVAIGIAQLLEAIVGRVALIDDRLTRSR